ncbi:apolipoprotein N-acyltransferase [Palleronia aestuarii]|uniref:Apolipoprotein N-acyltransferase n=1 Tax=Palleronia aestuarii TaxID=568105 RepID=A0A2W7NMH5_9RHOB|nr:apolipoprotein N-acyltransferase [Palleronia aestuarii]PZX12472.1 apolipoprotein N-acyltransferase [Palleronia aestuarii]
MQVGSKRALRQALLPYGAAAFAAFAAGAAAVLALPPYSILALVPVAYGALFLLVRGRAPSAACAIGWVFGLGYFGFGLSWIGESFQVDAERFGALAIPAIAGLSALLAIFPALAMAVFGILCRRTRIQGAAAAVLFATCWTGAEWLRGHALTGFPWNLSAYALTDYAPLRQPAAWVGSYGLGFLVFLASAVLAQAIVARGTFRRASLLFAGIVVAGAWGAGLARLALPLPAPPGISLRVVQGNVPQQEKWAPGNAEATLSRYLALSAQGGPVDAVLWPETAFPGFLDEDASARRRISVVLPEGSVLLTGVPDRVMDGTEALYFNTIQAYGRTGEALTGYAKHHLVPFGEYVPLRGWLPLDRLTVGLGDFTSGPGPRTLAIAGLPLVAATICYEIIFPGHAVDDRFRPGWIFNATNDAWFGTSIGPEQHLASARMRAVEEGLPVVRAANTGISAVIDARGRVLHRLGLEQTGAFDAELPPALSPTLYARFGDVMLLPLILAAWVLGLGLNRLNPHPDRRHRRHS